MYGSPIVKLATKKISGSFVSGFGFKMRGG